MCRKTTCDQCGKATWAGCGQHVDEALKGVPMSDRCPGHEPAEAAKPGLFRRLRGR
jgi:hypothetical protein